MTGKEYAKKEYPNLEEGQKQMLAKAFDTGKDYAETDLASIAYMQGAEPREKRIAELEKENAELKHNKKTVAHLAGCLEEKMKERIEELERLNSNQAESLRVTMLEEEKKGKRIAGLKAGRTQWHDLRKDPNDLPPKMLVNSNFSIDVLSDKGEIVCYNFHYCEWFYWRSGSPIAWCEIPTFDKE